jgi:hypothetical protein
VQGTQKRMGEMNGTRRNTSHGSSNDQRLKSNCPINSVFRTKFCAVGHSSEKSVDKIVFHYKDFQIKSVPIMNVRNVVNMQLRNNFFRTE